LLKQQQQPQSGAIFPGVERDEQLAQDVGLDRIRQAKIKVLSGINQVSQALLRFAFVSRNVLLWQTVKNSR